MTHKHPVWEPNALAMSLTAMTLQLRRGLAAALVAVGFAFAFAFAGCASAPVDRCMVPACVSTTTTTVRQVFGPSPT